MPLANRHHPRELSEQERYPAVSLYLPAESADRAPGAVSHEAEAMFEGIAASLARTDLSSREVRRMIDPVRSVLEHEWLPDERGGGMAAFAAPGYFRWFQTAMVFPARWEMGRRFFLLPLIASLQIDRRCFVLELTAHGARLHAATRHGMRQIPLPQLAKSPSEVVTPAGLLEHCRRVNQTVCRALRGQDGPLLLASVGYLAMLYESVNSYGYLVREKIPGDPQGWKPAELRLAGWKRIQPCFQRERKRILSQVEQAREQHRISTDLEEVVRAAAEGRTETLLVRSDPELSDLDSSPADAAPARDFAAKCGLAEQPVREAASQAANLTLRGGGEVLLLTEMPEPVPVLAVLRS